MSRTRAPAGARRAAARALACKRLGPVAFIALSLVLAALSACGRGEPDLGGGPLERVRLATTTSARDTGLLEWLKPELARGARVDLFDVAVGTGQALELGRRGDADLVLVHDRAREDAYVAEGWGIERGDLMWNDFVLVGPADDPAGLKGARDAAGALRRIAAAQAPFVSRGDDSGAHAREKALWARAGGRPSWPGYAEAGQGQGPTLLIADERRAYTLTDRATYLSMRGKLALAPLVEGDPALRNPYGVMLVSPAKVPGVRAEAARRALAWLLSPEGQARIGAFQVAGEGVFHPGAPPR